MIKVDNCQLAWADCEESLARMTLVIQALRSLEIELQNPEVSRLVCSLLIGYRGLLSSFATYLQAKRQH